LLYNDNMDLIKNKGCKSILIVEDDGSIRSIIEQLLLKAGYSVETAANGMHALQKLNTGKKIDLIICDYKMPGIDGHKLFNIAKETDRFKAIPFLFVSGYLDQRLVVTLAKKGILGAIAKPFKLDLLLTKVRDFFSSGLSEAT